MKINKREWFTQWQSNIKDLDIPSHWEDSTWHNDATCSFTNNGKQVWVDAKDVKDSTDFDNPKTYVRFALIDEEDYGESYDKSIAFKGSKEDWETVKEIMNNDKSIKEQRRTKEVN
tara:strand:- start:568 stop:915 length:348 start_codon:yes stop_codon:yes gene_type:complete